MQLLDQINAILTSKFESLDDLLFFYRRVLPERTAGYHQEEVGPVMHDDAPGEADKFVAKIFHLGEHTLDMSGGLDWYATPNGDLEWNGGLVRHGYLMLLAEEYRKTGDEKYAAAVIEHILDYIRNVPRFDPAGKPYLEYKKSTWRPFEVAGRAAETWPEALGKIISSGCMTPEAWAEIMLSIHEHADFLSLHHWRTGNHACLEVAALGLIGVFYQEFKEAEAWRRYAVDFLMKMWPEQFHPDGYTKEMSGGYHWVAMRSFFTYYEVASRNGFADLFPPAYVERLKLTSLAELWQSKPDFTVPITNDSNTKTNRQAQLARIDGLFNLPAIRYRLSGGKEGTPPVHTSYFFPEARVGVMRSDWTDTARYLFFDLGRWGDNHMNEDQLHVEVSAYGRKFLVGCGRWRYTTSPDAPWMPWAKYFKTTAAYNSILVDGYGQVPGDADGWMRIREGYDYAEGVFGAGYGEDAGPADEKLLQERGVTTGKVVRVAGITHKRQIIFVKPCFWVLRDTVTGAGEHEAEQLWHYYDGPIAPDPSGRFLVTDFPDANLILATAGGNPVEANVWTGSEDPIRGWHCPYYDQKRPAPELSFRQRGRDEIVFHTLIFPVQGRPAEMPGFDVTPEGYAVRYGGKTWVIRAPGEGEWGVG
ncbi:MAG: heparinase II/III family protein [Bacteroidota bacterium]